MYSKEKSIKKRLLKPHILLAFAAGFCILVGGSSAAMAAGPDGYACQLLKVNPCEKMGLFQGSCVSVDQLRQMQIDAEPLLVLDVRSSTSYKQAHIEGSLLVPTKLSDAGVSLAEHLKEYTKDTPIVAYCDVGCHASSALVLEIKRLGYTNVKVMEDGFQVWEEKGYPVSQGT